MSAFLFLVCLVMFGAAWLFILAAFIDEMISNPYRRRK